LISPSHNSIFKLFIIKKNAPSNVVTHPFLSWLIKIKIIKSLQIKKMLLIFTLPPWKTVPVSRTPKKFFMSPDKACFDFIKSREGLRLNAYQDSAGIWTIGYGTIRYANNTAVKKGDTITQAQADQLIEEDIFERSIKVAAALGTIVLNQNQFNALVSFAYNAGLGALLNSTLLKQVKANPADPNIRNSFMLWNKVHQKGRLVPVKGLTLRRAAEADMYFS